MTKELVNSSKKIVPRLTDGEKADLADEIAKRIGALVPPGQKAQVVAQVVSLVQQERFSGPIAHPKHLREYEEILPGSADRIIAMAERSLNHAQDIQMHALRADVGDVKAGRWFGFAALIVLIASAFACGYLGNNTLALAFLATGALGAIGAFIKGRGAQKE
ncbi:DUF2335 domain-containing protein [Sphingobium sp.]|uniref:DUF2335 domain-containing protein n=1 Tax=Sphingobium sp. TaxID=1912891 RepID=UPI002CE29CC1|nr:DUF2335 domain-containing protein [Sphingobium sp.]HUD93421.1 DUF2335 domain-containing protein [Sphingobium sp.]